MFCDSFIDGDCLCSVTPSLTEIVCAFCDSFIDGDCLCSVTPSLTETVCVL